MSVEQEKTALKLEGVIAAAIEDALLCGEAFVCFRVNDGQLAVCVESALHPGDLHRRIAKLDEITAALDVVLGKTGDLLDRLPIVPPEIGLVRNGQ